MCSVHSWRVRQATIHSLLNENSQDATTELFSSVKTGYAESIVTYTYVPFGINWLTWDGREVAYQFLFILWESSVVIAWENIRCHWSNSVSYYCITNQFISLTRRDNGQWSICNVDFCCCLYILFPRLLYAREYLNICCEYLNYSTVLLSDFNLFELCEIVRIFRS